MGKISKIIITLFVVILAVILLLQIDDNLDLEAQNMYEQAFKPKESEAYIYLLGMPATSDKNPEVVGTRLLGLIKEAEKDYKFGTTKFDSARLDNELPSFQLDYCNDCDYIDKLFSHKFDSDKLKNDHKILLQRYNKLLSLKDYHTLSLPYIESPLPSFHYVMQGNDLANLVVLEHAKNNINEAIKMLETNILSLRYYLQQADTLITKMIFTTAINKNFDVLSLLIHKHKAHYKGRIEPLTLDEKSFVKAMNYEAAFYHIGLKSMNRSTDILGENDYIPGWLSTNMLNNNSYIPGWLSRILLKPNMTINANFPIFKKVAQNSLLGIKAFSKKVAISVTVESKGSYIRNYVGTVLAQVSSADFNQYTARVFHLDAKIKLFNKTANLAELPATVSYIRNPFYDNKTAAYSKDKKSICIDAPFSRKKEHRCLRVR